MKNLTKPFATALVCAASLILAPAAGAQAASSNQLKAAILFNILRFVDFAPGDAGAVLQLCVPASTSGLRELAALHGQRANSRVINFRVIDAGRYSGCNIIYLGNANSAEISSASRSGVLVMGEGTSFINRGGAVGLVQMGNQYRFEVNTRVARSANVTISSKLLRLAARVQG